MRCLVTGATGFIGSHLTRFLLQHNIQVSILMREESDPWRIRDILPDVQILQGDLKHIDTLTKQLGKAEFDVIFHLAWYGANSAKYKNTPDQVYENVSGSLALVQLAQKCNAQRWIGFGSVLEYGRYNGVFSESLQPLPDTLYGSSKYAVCMLAQKLCQAYQIRFFWVRPFWLYGPADDPLRLIPFVIQSLLRGQEPALTRGEQLWDYLYIYDAIEAIWLLATHPTAQGIFNLGSGKVYTIRSIVEQIRDLIDPRLSLGFGRVPYAVDQIMHLQADITNLQQTIGWSPQTHLIDGLTRTINWYRQNIDLYER